VDSFLPSEIIRKKRQGKSLNKQEIGQFIEGLMKGTVADYQMSALLMAITLNGMNDEETLHLTEAYMASGKVFHFHDSTTIDKHSTGGVGDKLSFILAPMAASCGVKVPMIAGRGLGHTGGTIDKIEVFPGINILPSEKEYQRYLAEFGIALSGQTPDIAPADGRIYALRDVTATIESYPLITASIMSKKIAGGASGIVFDIKTGSGAFMQSFAEAESLARSMLQVGKAFNKKMSCLITSMDQPLGQWSGHTHELRECFALLKGEVTPQNRAAFELSLELASTMVHLAYPELSFEQAKERVHSAWKKGEALTLFENWLIAQGAHEKHVRDFEKSFAVASEKTAILASGEGYLNAMDCRELGLALVELGAGRRMATDKIDFQIGLEKNISLGEKVSRGTPLYTLHHHKEQKDLAERVAKRLSTLALIEEKRRTPPLLFQHINDFSKR
jgi:pyrimidine-nucleoside phosphorylase